MIRIFVARIPSSVTGFALTELFSKYGQVSSARVSINRTSGDSLGNAYVDMDYQADAMNAISELNGSEMEGRKIVVSRAVHQ